MSNYSILYISLGKAYDPILIDFAARAKIQLPQTRLFLLTDNPNWYKAFPGQVILYSPTERIKLLLKKIARRQGAIKFRAQGYWIKTFERLLALELLIEAADICFPLIHAENDILFFGNQQHFELFQDAFNKAAALKWNLWGNAGVLFLPNKKEALNFIRNIEYFAEEEIFENTWSIDMPIIGRLLNERLIDTLPVVEGFDFEKGKLLLSREIEIDGMKILTDSGDLGTYLFGRNSVYTNGVITQGHLNEHVNWPITESRWKVDVGKEDKRMLRLNMKIKDNEYAITFLHVASKIPLAANNANELRNLLPIGLWHEKPNFPASGFSIDSRHKESHLDRAISMLWNRTKCLRSHGSTRS